MITDVIVDEKVLKFKVDYNNALLSRFKNLEVEISGVAIYFRSTQQTPTPRSDQWRYRCHPQELQDQDAPQSCGESWLQCDAGGQ